MSRSIYVVSYVGLSDSDYWGNGYNEVHAFVSKEDAVKKMKALRDSEIAFCKEAKREYEILEDAETEFRMSWSSHGEQVRIYMTKVQLNEWL